MDIEVARTWIVMATLAITGANFLFFFTAPTLGFPLTFEQAVRLLEIVLPVFFGYLGSATHFLFRTGRPTELAQASSSSKLLGLLVRGPVIIFGLATFSAIFAFGFSNRRGAAPGEGMSVDALAAALSATLGLLAVSTNIIVSYLFPPGARTYARQPQGN